MDDDGVLIVACCVRCFIHMDDNYYEERITYWKTSSMDDAHNKAAEDARRYAANVGGVALDFTECYGMDEEPTEDGVEVYSNIRQSDLSPREYIERFYDTGNEFTRKYRANRTRYLHDDVNVSWVHALPQELIDSVRRFLWPANITAERGVGRAEHIDMLMAEERARRGLSSRRILPETKAGHEQPLPQALAAKLKREITDQPEESFEVRGLALNQLLSEERLLMLDHEKLAGHLVLRHHEAGDNLRGATAAMTLRRHAAAHRRSAGGKSR